MTSWLVSPWLFFGGSLLIASPIIIHLLNKRKFKTVDWAAMDFLVEAHKRNRRRIRLEDLLLLLLRCLAVLLIALLVARPFLSLSYIGGLFDSVRFDRIVLLDDSPSMEARAGNSSAWQDAKRGLIDCVTGLAATNSHDSITLFVASQPRQPLLNGLPINDETVAEITDEIRDLEASDLSANFDAALVEIEKTLDQRSADMNRVVYVLSDMRHRDWGSEQASGAKGLPATLKRVSEQAAGCFLVDVGADDTNNLAVTQITSLEKVLAAGVASRFDVTVENMGQRDASRVTVQFTAGGSIPMRGEIDVVPAGSAASIPFTYTFARPEDPRVTFGGLEDQSVEPALEPVPIRAEISVEGMRSADRLAADNVRYYAARIVNGMPTLLVDGDRSVTYGRSESVYLERALAPPGEFLSGIAVDTKTDAEFETFPIDRYQVIYLCNVYRLSDERRNALEAWVASGGGLVIALGDQIDEEFYNNEFYRDGEGLFPVKIETICGDESEESWVYFDADSSNHPVLGAFEGENNPLAEGVKVFQWWGSAVAAEELRAGCVSCPARFTDPEKSAAVVEKGFGDGRVLALTTALDEDWSSWPASRSFVITMQELNRYAARKNADEGSIIVGEPLRHPLDLTKHKMNVSISGPGVDAAPIQASLNSDHWTSRNESLCVASYDETARRGFYQMTLSRIDGQSENILFAANIDGTEGNLKRVDQHVLRRDLGDARVKMVRGAGLAELTTEGARGELWVHVLGVLAMVLCGEQILAWLFGLRR